MISLASAARSLFGFVLGVGSLAVAAVHHLLRLVGRAWQARSVPRARQRRFPTREAIDSLARRFNLPNHPDMQDWEWEVADPQRLDEFLSAYESACLNDDERFVLMEIILQSCEDLPGPLDECPSWSRALRHLDRNLDLHIHSVWYWAALEDGVEDAWRVTPFLRQILEKHERR